MKLLFLLTALSLSAQVELTVDLTTSHSSDDEGSRTTRRKETWLFQDGNLRRTSAEGFLLLRAGSPNLVIANTTDRRYHEYSVEERLKSLRANPTPEMGKVEITDAPPITWNGQPVAGKRCSTTMSAPLSITTWALPYSADNAALAETVHRSFIEWPDFVLSIVLAKSELAACLPANRLIVKLETSFGDWASNSGGQMRIRSVKPLASIDPSCFVIPPLWPAVADKDAVEVRNVFLSNGDYRLRQRINRLAEGLKDSLRNGTWTNASIVMGEIQQAIRTAQALADGPKEDQLEQLEMSTNLYSTLRAAAIALELGQLDRARKNALAITSLAKPTTPDQRHDAHTILGLIALHEGERKAAIDHLQSAGRSSAVSVVRTELAEALAVAGEFIPVADYYQSCAAKAELPAKREMYQRAAAALRANVLPNVTGHSSTYKIPERKP